MLHGFYCNALRVCKLRKSADDIYRNENEVRGLPTPPDPGVVTRQQLRASLDTTPSTRLRGTGTCNVISLYETLSIGRARARTFTTIRSAPPSNPLTLPKLLVATVTLLDRPVPSYLDLRTGALFANGGVEKEFHALPIHGYDRPPALPHATGSVIMSKLGNETAKYVLV